MKQHRLIYSANATAAAHGEPQFWNATEHEYGSLEFATFYNKKWLLRHLPRRAECQADAIIVTMRDAIITQGNYTDYMRVSATSVDDSDHMENDRKRAKDHRDFDEDVKQSLNPVAGTLKATVHDALLEIFPDYNNYDEMLVTAILGGMKVTYAMWQLGKS